MPRLDARADLSLRWTHMSFCWFCRVLAHFKPNAYAVGGRAILAIYAHLQVLISKFQDVGGQSY